MHRTIRGLLACALVAAAVAAPIPSQGWKDAGNPSFAPTLLYGFAKLAVDKDGGVWALVNNKSTAGNLEVYKLAKGATEWAKVGRGVIYDNGYNGSIAVDSAGTPWIASKGIISYWDGKKWQATAAGTYWTDSGKHYAKAYEPGNFCSLAVDPSGGVYLAIDYYAGVYARDTKLAGMKWDDSVYDASRLVSFFPIGSDKTEYGVGYKPTPNYAGNPTIKWANGALYLAYDEFRLSSRWGFHVSKWNGKGWTDLGDFGSDDYATGGYSEGGAELLDIAISKSGKIFVAYREESNAPASRQWKLSAMLFDGKDDWLSMGPKGFSGSTVEAFPLSAAWDSKENAYVCFADEENGTVVVMKYDGKAWSRLGGIVANGASPHMVIAPDDTIYVAFREKGATGSISVKRFVP